MTPAALKAEIEAQYKDKTYKGPDKAGLSYMVSPLMRALGPPDMKLHSMFMPHPMFYAPNISNPDIGAAPDLNLHASLMYPFIDRQGVGEQSYMIQLIGETEKAMIMADEKPLIQDLCAYRPVLSGKIETSAAPTHRRGSLAASHTMVTATAMPHDTSSDLNRATFQIASLCGMSTITVTVTAASRPAALTSASQQPNMVSPTAAA
jgi:hypothetical protein